LHGKRCGNRGQGIRRTKGQTKQQRTKHHADQHKMTLIRENRLKLTGKKETLKQYQQRGALTAGEQLAGTEAFGNITQGKLPDKLLAALQNIK
jgi:hypothetical protein